MNGDLQFRPLETLLLEIFHFQMEFLLQRGIPMVLDGVVGSTIEVSRYLSPLVAEMLMQNEEAQTLVIGPRLLVDRRIQMIVPPR